jgi:hypothetical protein
MDLVQQRGGCLCPCTPLEFGQAFAADFQLLGLYLLRSLDEDVLYVSARQVQSDCHSWDAGRTLAVPPKAKAHTHYRLTIAQIHG